MNATIETSHCKHTSGTINGHCITCGELVSYRQKKYNYKLRRITNGGIKMAKGIIDFEVLEKHIIGIEKLMKDNGLNQVEQDLLLKQTHNRLQRKIEEQKAKDMLSNMPGMKFINRFIKDNE